MLFTPITANEFGKLYKKQASNLQLTNAIDHLVVGAGFSTPCIWNHSVSTSQQKKKDGSMGKVRTVNLCLGAIYAQRAAKREEKKRRIQATCKDGTLYTCRIE
jgi:phosphoenolpyruvate synthase/pyruvate phosphate dikinase